jgi:UDP-N-acetylmuramoylalanine--D-glutamate ligase
MNESSALQALEGKRIGVLGYGVNNAVMAPWLVRHGFQITISDTDPAAEERFLADHADLSGKVQWDIRKNTLEDLNRFDVVFRTPAVPFHAPELQKAVQQGITVTSQTKLFFQLAPCEIIGITGSKGKGTTSSLIANILKCGYTKGKVYLAGNIGIDPFTFVDELTEDDLVVLELSSFQLTDLHLSPHVAVVLHVVPEHLDHHRTAEAYREAKLQLLAHQRSGDLAVVNGEYPDMAMFLNAVQGKLLRYARHIPQKEAAWAENLDGREVVFVQTGDSLESIDITGRKIVGDHNLENILPAVLVGLHYGISPLVIQKEIVEFPGLDHRISLVGTYNGVSFYDDSIATTPESALAAMEAFPGRRIHLLIGGKSGGQTVEQFDEVIHAALERCVSVSFIPGSFTPELEKRFKKIAKQRPDCDCLFLNGAQQPIMETLLSGLHPHLQSGDVVILSPAAKSFDHFKSYKDRAEHFVKAVKDRYEPAS